MRPRKVILSVFEESLVGRVQYERIRFSACQGLGMTRTCVRNLGVALYLATVGSCVDFLLSGLSSCSRSLGVPLQTTLSYGG